MLLRTARILRSGITQTSAFSIRDKHFLADGPLKRRGVEGNVPVSDFDGKLLLLYFSAGWCGSCKIFTKKLKKFHDALGNDVNKLEVVWISRDKEADHQLEYYEKAMPAWAYIPFGDPRVKEYLEKYEVKTIPVLKLVDSQGNVLSDAARADVMDCLTKDPKDCLAKWEAL